MVYPGGENFTHRHIRRGEGGFDQTWSPRGFDIKVNCVCVRCNGEWMERLDLDAESAFLTHAVTGYGARLGQSERGLIARWCSLVAILFDQVQHAPVLDADVHRTLFDGAVPDGTMIWLARTEPPLWKMAIWAEPREWRLGDDSSNALNAYFMSFGVGHLVAQTFIPTKRTPEGIELDRSANAAVVRELWPGNFQPFIWPPPQTLPWEQLEELKDAFGVWSVSPPDI
jgi:hypothetical protein